MAHSSFPDLILYRGRATPMLARFFAKSRASRWI
jgi:hypothetical protein